MASYISIKEAMKKGSGKVKVRGWIHRERGSNKLKFVVLRDSSGIIQCVIEKSKVGETLFKLADKLRIETSLSLEGEIKKDERAPTGYEINVNNFNIIGECDNFPLGKDQSREFLDDNRHLWLRSRKMQAILKIRSSVIGSLHNVVRDLGFIEVEAPSFSGTTSEGGSETFEVKYFNTKVYLTQSWQFYAENIISAVEKAYAMAPSFRAEKSKTSRHLTEFWHFEVEGAWMDMEDMIKLSEKCVLQTIKKVLEQHKEELNVLDVDVKKLKNIKAPFSRITYDDAIKKLQSKGHSIKRGQDFGAKEEKALAKYLGENWVVVTNYPLEILKFYHGEDFNYPGTGKNFNILSADIGEMIDGSEREPDLEKIKKKLKKSGINLGDADWYLDSRRYGSVPHAGFGLGTERFVQWICGLDNIKDAIAFPRTITRWSP